MDGRKVLATLGTLAFVWPGALIVALLPFYMVGRLLDLPDGSGHPALGVLVVLICGSTATWFSIRVFRRVFRRR